jgi:leucyl aminopeptidase
LVQFLQDRADVANGNVVRRGRPRREAVEAGSEE